MLYDICSCWFDVEKCGCGRETVRALVTKVVGRWFMHRRHAPAWLQSCTKRCSTVGERTDSGGTREVDSDRDGHNCYSAGCLQAYGEPQSCQRRCSLSLAGSDDPSRAYFRGGAARRKRRGGSPVPGTCPASPNAAEFTPHTEARCMQTGLDCSARTRTTIAGAMAKAGAQAQAPVTTMSDPPSGERACRREGRPRRRRCGVE